MILYYQQSCLKEKHYVSPTLTTVDLFLLYLLCVQVLPYSSGRFKKNKDETLVIFYFETISDDAQYTKVIFKEGNSCNKNKRIVLNYYHVKC